MNIGLDWDGTVTSDPVLFYTFCLLAKRHNHKVYIVTMRYPSECGDIDPVWREVVEGIYATGNPATQDREAKANFMLRQGSTFTFGLTTIHERFIIQDDKFGVTLVHLKVMSSHQPTINEHHFTLQVVVPETEDSQKVIEVLGNL